MIITITSIMASIIIVLIDTKCHENRVRMGEAGARILNLHV